MSGKEEGGTRYNGFVEKRELVEVVDEGGGGGGGWRTGVEGPGGKSGPLLWLRRTPSGPSHVRILAGAFCALLALCLVLVVALIFTASCSGKRNADVCTTEDCVKTAARLLEAMDGTVDPCVDFFEYACGTWNRMHVIPADKGSINIFELLTDQLQVVLKGLLEEPFDDEENTSVEDSATRKAKLFYNTCLNIEEIRRVADKPLRRALDALGGWPIVIGRDWTEPSWSLEHLLAKVRTQYNEGIIIEQWIDPDDKNSSANILQLDQMKLALPTKDSYLNKDMYPGHIPAYRRYMTEVAFILGADRTVAATDVEDVIRFEIELANVSIPELDKLDAIMNYKKLTIRQLSESVPQVDWLEYLRTILNETVTEDENIVTYAMPYLVKMGPILARTPKRTVYNYVLWRVVMTISPHLIDGYQAKNIEFRQIIHGVLAERNRWRQCVDWTNKMMGMAVGKLYIRKNFNQHNKETALRMIHTIREAFNDLLVENHWMDDETKAVAKEKANAMNERIGFPEMINDPDQLNNEYKLLKVTEGEFIENLLRVYRWEAAKNLAKWKRPVDRDKWSTEPAIINAFYSPNKNDIVFPAGILQPLFYSPHFPKSLNYGGIGVVIGHEITHGFDDKGRLFDKDGNMMQWWNNNTVREFRERAQCFVDQYNRYKFNLVDKFVDGRMTQGENIADNGGLKQSYRAYRKWVEAHGEEPRLPGLDLTHDQLFFLNFAQIWCGTSRPEEALIKHHTAVHSPSPIRVIGPLSNSLDFSRAYSCNAGTPMNPIAKCSVW